MQFLGNIGPQTSQSSLHVDFSAFMELAKIIGLPSLIVALITYLFM